MDVLAYIALFVVGPLLLAGYVCYVCRGRPASVGRRRAKEMQALQEIERHMLVEGTVDTETGN